MHKEEKKTFERCAETDGKPVFEITDDALAKAGITISQ
jgi:hypothetical protein